MSGWKFAWVGSCIWLGIFTIQDGLEYGDTRNENQNFTLQVVLEGLQNIFNGISTLENILLAPQLGNLVYLY